MPDFEWMESRDFRNEIERMVEMTAERYRIRRYERAIIDSLMEHLVVNRRMRIIQESAKPIYQQRTKNDALNSVRILIEDASRFAIEDKREVLTLDDFNKAYSGRFCMIWPFC